MGILKKIFLKVSLLLLFFSAQGSAFAQTDDSVGEPKLGSVFYFPKAGSGLVDVQYENTLLYITTILTYYTTISETKSSDLKISVDHSFTDFLSLKLTYDYNFTEYTTSSIVGSSTEDSSETAAVMDSPSLRLKGRVLGRTLSDLFLDLVIRYTFIYDKDNGFTGEDIFGGGFSIGKQSNFFAYQLNFGVVYSNARSTKDSGISKSLDPALAYNISANVQWFIGNVDLTLGLGYAIADQLTGTASEAGQNYTYLEDSWSEFKILMGIGYQIIPNRFRIYGGLNGSFVIDKTITYTDTATNTPTDVDSTNFSYDVILGATFNY